MRKNVNRVLSAALFAGGLLAASTATAHADDLVKLDDEIRVGNVLSVPVKVCGNAVGVLGKSEASCESGAEQRAQAEPALVSAPVTVCGNGVGVLGDAAGSCGTPKSEPSGSLITAPVTVCGVAAGVGGDASGDCGGTEEPPGEEPPGEEPPGQEPPGQEPPGQQPPGQQPPNQPPGSGLDDIGDHLGHGRPSLIGSPAAQAQEVLPIKPLPQTGAEALQLLLLSGALLASGAMARRAVRRQA